MPLDASPYSWRSTDYATISIRLPSGIGDHRLIIAVAGGARVKPVFPPLRRVGQRASTCSAPPTERARCAQPVWLLSALACCRPELGHQLDHYFVVDGDKIGGKSGVGLAEIFSLILAAKNSTQKRAWSLKLLGSTRAKWAIFMVNLRAGTFDNHSRSRRSCLLLLVYDYLRSCFARLCCFPQQRQALICQILQENGRVVCVRIWRRVFRCLSILSAAICMKLSREGVCKKSTAGRC